jgi:hypothetical protein
MLSVRLPAELEADLDQYCISHSLSKSSMVQIALRKYFSETKQNPFLALVGSGNGKYTTEEIMRMSRGDDWNQL